MTGNASYDPHFFKPIYEVEDHHFWFRTRNEVLANVCEQVVAHLSPGYRVLEVGCGTGNVLRMLKARCSQGVVVGMDLFGEGLSYAQRRSSAALLQGDMHHPPFRVPLDVIGLFDVLEHLPDDRQVLTALRGMLVAGGYLVLTVPAYPALWSYFDESAYHCRRYTPQDLQQKLTEAGFEIEFCTPFMMSLFPLVWLGRRVAAWKAQEQRDGYTSAQSLTTDELRVRPGINELLRGLLKLESRWLARGKRFPFGTSLLVVAANPR